MLTDLHFDMKNLVYILNKRQQFKNITLENGVLGQSKKTDIFMFSFESLKRDWRSSERCLHSEFFYLSTVSGITLSLMVHFHRMR